MPPRHGIAATGDADADALAKDSPSIDYPTSVAMTPRNVLALAFDGDEDAAENFRRDFTAQLAILQDLVLGNLQDPSSTPLAVAEPLSHWTKDFEMLGNNVQRKDLKPAKEQELRAGGYVRINGLKSRLDLNGQNGMLIHLDETLSRWQVVMENCTGVLIKSENLIAESGQSQSAAPNGDLYDTEETMSQIIRAQEEPDDYHLDDDDVTMGSRMSNESLQSVQGCRVKKSGPLTNGARDASTLPAVGMTPALDMKKPVFADATAMKDKVREAIHKKAYKVADLYWEIGIARTIATSSVMEHLTLVVITLNAFWIAIDTQFNDAELLLNAAWPFVVAENLFCLCFFVEWFVRFCAFKHKLSGFLDRWFIFDSTLVFVMVMETWVMNGFLLVLGTGSSSEMGNASILRMVRLLRLMRMARMARLLRAVPELMILVRAITVAFRSVFFTIWLLMLIIYVFAIGFVQWTDGTDIGKKYFDGVPAAMGTLLLAGNLPDHEMFIGNIMKGNFMAGMALMVFIFLAPLTVMGMLAGVLVEVVSVVSAVEKESNVVSFVTESLWRMLGEVDTDNSCSLSQQEFQRLLVRPDAARMMASVGVDVMGLAEFCDFLFCDAEEISFGNFIDLVLQLRGTNQATVKDIVDMRKFVRQELSDMVITELETMELKLCSDIPRTTVKMLQGKTDVGPAQLQKKMTIKSAPILPASTRCFEINERDEW